MYGCSHEQHLCLVMDFYCEYKDMSDVKMLLLFCFSRNSLLPMRMRIRYLSAPASTRLLPICTYPTTVEFVTHCHWRTSCTTVRPTLFTGCRKCANSFCLEFFGLWSKFLIGWFFYSLFHPWLDLLLMIDFLNKIFLMIFDDL